MIMKIILLLFSLIYLPAISQDSTEFIHPIEIEMTKCLESDSNYSTQAMLECTYKSTTSWQQELIKNQDIGGVFHYYWVD